MTGETREQAAVDEAWRSSPWTRKVEAGEAPGASVHRAHHDGEDRIVVHMDDLERLCLQMGVDFEIDPSGLLIPLPEHVSDDGRELTDDEVER